MIQLILSIAGFSIAFLSTILGIGGGVFTVPLLYFSGKNIIPPEQTGLFSISVSLFLAFVFSASASWRNWSLNQISFQHSIFLIIGAGTGAFGASLLTTKIESSVLMNIFSFFLLINGTYGFIKLLQSKCNKTQEKELFIEDKTGMLVKSLLDIDIKKKTGLLIAGVSVGMLSSFTGVGGGIIIVPLLLNGFKLSPRIAISTSTFCIVFITLSGVIAYFLQSLHMQVSIPQPRIGFMYLPFMIPLVVGGIVGGYFGSQFTRKIPKFYLAAILALTQLLIAIKILAF